jgi:hypothetical protein
MQRDNESLISYQLDGQGKRVPDWGVVQSVKNFVTTQRPWYRKIKAANRFAWQNVYVFSSGILGITAGSPVYITNATTGVKEYAGIFAVDTSINKLNTYLSGITITDNGKCFIMDYTGLFVAASSGSVLDGYLRALNATQSSDPMIATTAQEVINRAGTGNNTKQFGFEYTISGHSNYVQVAAFKLLSDISWVISVVVPRDDLLGAVLYANFIIYATIPVGAVLSVIAAIAMSICITRPLSSLRKEMLQVSKMELDAHKEKSTYLSEIHFIESSFYAMLYSLRSFKKYVPQTILENTQQEKFRRTTTNKNVAIVALDILNFDHAAELLPPSDLLLLMTDFMKDLQVTANRYQASIDTHVSDAIVVIFNSAPDQYLDACKFVLAVKAKMKDRKDEWREKGIPILKCAMTIHGGNCLIGNFGLGRQITAMGKVVNDCTSMLAECSKYGIMTRK